MTGLGCALTSGVFEECKVKTLLTCNGDISLSGRNILYFGDKGASMAFTDQVLSITAATVTCSNTLKCETLKTTSIMTGQSLENGGSNILNITGGIDTQSVTAESITVNTLNIKKGSDVYGIDAYIKKIIKDSVTVSVASGANDTTVSGGENGVYTVTTTDNTTVTASQTICCYTDTQPSGGYFKTTETTGDPPSGSYYTYCTKAKSEKKDISTSGTIKVTITVKED